ncbi:MAG: hypothetical protein KDD42_03325 [Bdellovibrionales bacterium]|nr:hypothetical protein [Bdellovibrionales bacterium]
MRILFLPLLILSCVNLAHALPQLRLGMSKADVVKLLGPASEKVEQEAKRADLWFYPDWHLKFIEGELSSWTLLEGGEELQSSERLASIVGNQVEAEIAPTQAVAPKDNPVRSKAKNASAKAGILEEILKALPSEDNAPPAAGARERVPPQMLRNGALRRP